MNEKDKIGIYQELENTELTAIQKMHLVGDDKHDAVNDPTPVKGKAGWTMPSVDNSKYIKQPEYKAPEERVFLNTITKADREQYFSGNEKKDKNAKLAQQCARAIEKINEKSLDSLQNVDLDFLAEQLGLDQK
jgi:hypothetical protein